MADVMVSVTYVDEEGSERTLEQSFEWNLETDPQRRPRAPFVSLKRKIETVGRDLALDLMLELAGELRETEAGS